MKPVALHAGRSITRHDMKKREEQENVYRVSRLRLEPPEELSERAKLKYIQIVNEAFWLDALSGDFLAAYCHAWDKWLECVAMTKDTPEVAFTKKRDGSIDAKQNPYTRAMRSHLLTMEEMSKLLGLSAIDRLRLLTPVTAQQIAMEMPVKNPFEAFMATVD